MANSRFTTFRDLVNNLHQHVPVHIPSPLEQPRRAAVVAILRWHCSRAQPSQKVPTSIQAFFDQNWVKEDKEGYAEILFMQRTARAGDRWSGHVAFVGGKNEQGESDRDTAKREVLEEIGIDLNDTSVFLPVGKLNEREISSIKDDKLLMILVPFVYLQIVPESPSFQLQASEVAAVQWVPLEFFLSREPYASQVIREPLSVVHVANPYLRFFVRAMMGSVCFPAIDLPATDRTFRLWGLTMGMTSDLIQFTQRNHLAFVNLTRSEPVFTRPDIGFLTHWITRIVSYVKHKRFLDPLTMNMLDRIEWDKVYFSSIRRAVMVAVLLRLGFTSMIMSFYIKRWIKKR